MSETGKDYALKNKFSILKLEEALIFGREHHKDKFFVADWVVERACDMERMRGAIEAYDKCLSLLKINIHSKEQQKDLIERIKELKELTGAKR